MTAFNIVRFRVKPGREEEFLEAHRKIRRSFPGLQNFSLVRTGDRTYCVVGQWANFNDIINARTSLISTLDSFRDCLEDLGMGLGMTDPVSGEAVMEFGVGRKSGGGGAKKRKAPAKRRPKKKAAKRKTRRR